MESFGERLDYALTLRGVDQTWLAKRIGTSPQAVSNWVRNETGCKKINQVAKALNVRPEWLEHGEEPIEPEKKQGALDAAIAKIVSGLNNERKQTILDMARFVQNEQKKVDQD